MQPYQVEIFELIVLVCLLFFVGINFQVNGTKQLTFNGALTAVSVDISSAATAILVSSESTTCIVRGSLIIPIGSHNHLVTQVLAGGKLSISGFSTAFINSNFTITGSMVSSGVTVACNINVTPGGVLNLQGGTYIGTINSNSGNVIAGGTVANSFFTVNGGTLTMLTTSAFAVVTITTTTSGTKVILATGSSGSTFNVYGGSIVSNTTAQHAGVTATISAGASMNLTDAPGTYIVAGTLLLAPPAEGTAYNVTVLTGGVATINGPTANSYFYVSGRLNIPFQFSGAKIFARAGSIVNITAPLINAAITVEAGGSVTLTKSCSGCTYSIRKFTEISKFENSL